jgi:hypothetical protein
VKHVYEEKRKLAGVISVNYVFYRPEREMLICGCQPHQRILFNPNSGFLEVTDDEKIKVSKPTQTSVSRNNSHVSWPIIALKSLSRLRENLRVFHIEKWAVEKFISYYE